MPLNDVGIEKDALFAELEALREADADWRHGRTFSLVYFAGESVLSVMRHAYAAYIHENGLSLDAFPSLRRMEGEVVANGCALFGASCGSITSGGTESVLMAVKAARDFGREKGIAAPRGNIVVPITAHPAFDKACHTLGIEIRKAPADAGMRADVRAMEALIDGDTMLLVASAFSFPHGVVDDVSAIAALAEACGTRCHVDACLGGMLLAFAGDAGFVVPPFDFCVPGVTSLSADLHKYGYTAKGASLVLYRDVALRRRQFFATLDWPGGIYASPTMAGTRPGGAIAAAWAVMRHLGREGYVSLTRRVLDTASVLRKGIAGIPGLALLGEPQFSVMAFRGVEAEGRPAPDIFAIEERMKRRGWHLDRIQRPAALQMIVSPAHVEAHRLFLADLADITAEVRATGAAAEADGAIYGALISLEDGALQRDLVLDWMDGANRG
jgi:glutamate/tyrosine decarboxylase-like PLP-dependent enzyme